MKSLWSATSDIPSFPKLNHDINVDVLIIGGGIAGLLTAYLLHHSGVNYALVEKNNICGGNTENTTAKITFQHGLIYAKLLKDVGAERAAMYLHAGKAAFERLTALCRGIDCDYEIRDNYVFSVDDRAKLENEISALMQIGYKAELCETKKLSLPFDVAGAVKFSKQAQFHPLKFLSVIAKELNIYENTFVKDIQENIAITDNAKISADNIIIASHFPFINRHGAYFLKLYQHRSYVIALENAQYLNGMYVDCDSKGLSFRNYDDFLLLGGGAHRTAQNGGNWKELRDFAKKYYPNATEQYFWAAQDCMSLDAMPYIGYYSKNTPCLYTATGFNKWGMTGSMLSAMILRDLVLKEKNDFTEVFSPSRSILKPQLFINALESVKGLVTPSKRRCPHMGCALKWNSAERSWDCPCHGSRFSEKGRILDNPSERDLD